MYLTALLDRHAKKLFRRKAEKSGISCRCSHGERLERKHESTTSRRREGKNSLHNLNIWISQGLSPAKSRFIVTHSNRQWASSACFLIKAVRRLESAQRILSSTGEPEMECATPMYGYVWIHSSRTCNMQQDHAGLTVRLPRELPSVEPDEHEHPELMPLVV